MKNTPPTRTRLTAAGSLALLLSAGLPVASAADLTWINASATANWNTSSLFWNDGSSDVAWTDNNAALFVGNGVARTITLTQNVQATSVSGNGTSGGTINFAGNFTLDVPKFTNTANANFDINVAITGSHGLTQEGLGRLVIYKSATYTGDTLIDATGLANSKSSEIYIKVNNALPTTTLLNLKNGTGYLVTAVLTLNGTTTTTLSQELTAITGNGIIQARVGHDNLTINTASGVSNTFSGTLKEYGAYVSTQSLGLTIKGAGTQELTGTNSYVGATLIEGGALKLGSNLSGTSSVTVNGGALASTVANVNLGLGGVSMSGSGSAISINGTSIGTLTLAASQNFTATTGTLNFTLGASNTSDKIMGTGVFSLTGTTLALDGATSVAGTYTLFSGFTGSNTVSGIIITGLNPAYSGVLGTDGILTVSLASIPEPSTYAAILGVAVLGFVAYRRRTKRD
ncbi:MAG: autotransporter-associated beta strand repeat-containing protein [Opitutaceae bacterium]|jgi:autotransporter-associated beta strand protein